MIRVLKAHVGHGEVGRDGALGFSDSRVRDRVLIPKSCDFWDEAISAHGPSTLFVELDEPTAVRGALNGSGWMPTDDNVCEFWIDYHWIGDVRYSARPTPWIHLPPGCYILRAAPTVNKWGAHSVWLFRSSGLPATGRLAATTIGCYPERELKSKLRWLYATAARQGILLHVFGVGEDLGSWFSSKIERIGGWLGVLPECYSHAIYQDGKDCLLIGTETEILERLSEFETPTAIGAEACPWPERSEAWCDGFKSPTTERFPQAGGWGGAISGELGLVDTLRRIAAMRAEWMDGESPEWLAKFRHFNDDQFLWQAYWRMHPEALTLDVRSSLFANMTCTNLDLSSAVSWPDGDRIVYANGNRPCCVHFSGHGIHRLGDWAGFLGVAPQ